VCSFRFSFRLIKVTSFFQFAFRVSEVGGYTKLAMERERKVSIFVRPVERFCFIFGDSSEEG